ncbi:MAG: metal-dependent phosphohydrolase, partial [Candidatus Wildermuthbacteria bacterium]|nr:metal-dependent phosphohydrolase [Candidatus Wildermuthbacteria bacterium]
IELVKKCILNHRGSQHSTRDSIEEKIVAEADVMSNFDNIPGIFKAAFVYENKGQGEGRIAVIEKLKRKWDQLCFENSKKIIKPKFEAAMLLFGYASVSEA